MDDEKREEKEREDIGSLKNENLIEVHTQQATDHSRHKNRLMHPVT